MNKIRPYKITTLFVIFCLVFMAYPVSADDTCVFSVTADDLPPNIVLLLDNGAEMEQIIWHSGYDNSVDYTPGGSIEVVGGPPVGATGFYNDRGYGIVKQGSSYRLVDIIGSLEITDYNDYLTANSSDTSAKTGTWNINGRSITLPAVPSSVAVGGVIDNANYFRYSKNYLNWLFFGPYAGDGSDLPNQTRFYKAKEAIMTVASGTKDKAKFGIYYFTNADGGSQAQPLAFVADGNGILTPAFTNNINNMGTVTYSPLAEGLQTVGYYYSSPSSGASGGYCQSNFVIVVSPGISSEDTGTGSNSSKVPDSLTDFDADDAAGGITEGKIRKDGTDYNIPVNQNGSTWLDDVAYYLYSHDIVGDAPSTGSLCYDGLTGGTGHFVVGETITGGTSGATGHIAVVNEDVAPNTGCLELESISGTFEDDEIITGSNSNTTASVNGSLFDSGEGYQNVSTYTVGFMGDQVGNLFLTNTSNNGNGKKNLYDSSDEDYGKYHFTAQSPDTLSAQLLAAVNSILSKTSTFMAPVVPVTRTFSGDRIYMAFFKPSENNFWEGNITKFGISSTNEIVDAHSPPENATWDNGAMKEDALPYWATIDWADESKSNYIDNLNRTIYTVLDNATLVTFDNTNITSSAILGTPVTPVADLINYVRGADIFDEDGDTETDDNRPVITGDVLHSEPVIFQYNLPGNISKTVVYFGANDGMLHAVFDEEDPPSTPIPNTPGTEMWAFIPPDQLPRLKYLIEGTSHLSYVDSTPKIYFKDDNHNGIVETSGGSNDQVILVCGERKGGTSYFALDVTEPFNPQFLWRITQNNEAGSGWTSTTNIIPELGETWSEPQIGIVKDGAIEKPVFFVGGGYSSDNSSGKAVIAINVINGSVVKKFTATDNSDMVYAIPSNVYVVDEDDNGVVDKVYVGDLGGQMWRIGKFSDGTGPLTFPNTNEDISTWEAHVFFKTDSTNSRKFFYPPSVTLEKGFDMVFMGTGDREDPCNVPAPTDPADIIAGVKDTHDETSVIVGDTDTDFKDVTDPNAPLPNIPTDDGWYIRLVDDSGSAVGEKVLSKGTVFYKTFYVTTFTPNDDPCAPGGEGKLYALSHLTGEAVMDYDGDSSNDRYKVIGGGIPSKPVIIITSTGTRLLVSVGSTAPVSGSPSTNAGATNNGVNLPPINFFYKFWKEAF
ncbi:MAG: pilus assembly protein [Candidatus Odinarchaeota archaeon]